VLKSAPPKIVEKEVKVYVDKIVEVPVEKVVIKEVIKEVEKPATIDSCVEAIQAAPVETVV